MPKLMNMATTFTAENDRLRKRRMGSMGLAVNVVAMFMSFGMFGSIFFLSQFLQVVQHYSPFAAGLRVLPWTGMPMVVAPVAAALAQRFGGRPVLSAGLALQATGLAWLALETSPSLGYGQLWLPFVLSGVGMALFFVPLASVVLSSVRPEEEGVASGANSAFRELGGVLGIAVLGAVFSARGGYTSGPAYVAGLRPAVWVGVAVVGAGAVVALMLPRRTRAAGTPVARTPAAGTPAAGTPAVAAGSMPDAVLVPAVAVLDPAGDVLVPTAAAVLDRPAAGPEPRPGWRRPGDLGVARSSPGCTGSARPSAAGTSPGLSWPLP